MSSNKLDTVCSVRHNTMFCTNENLCAEDQHKERSCLEKELEERRQKIRMRVEQKEKELEELRRRSSCAEAALKLSKDTFSKMIKLMKGRKKSMEQQAKSMQHEVQTGSHVHLDLLTEDIEDLDKQISLRESLLETQDAYEFFLKSNSLLEMPIVRKARRTFGHWLPLRKFTFDKNQAPMSVTALSFFHNEDPAAYLHKGDVGWRAVFRSITWDPNTAHRNVTLQTYCEGNKWAIFKSQPRDYQDHPERFSDCVQVLSREPLTGRCYFEVCPRGDSYIGFTYKSIQRKGRGKQCVLGLNNKSWACFGGGFLPQSTKNGTWLLMVNIRGNRVGVFLDHRLGILRFYSVSETEALGMSLLYEVERRFTEPLYFGAVFVTPGDHVVICKAEEGQDVVFMGDVTTRVECF